MPFRKLFLRPGEIHSPFAPFGWTTSPFTVRITVVISTLFSFISLTTATFSAPISKSIYFLRTNQGGGVVIGLWGWCRSDDGFCSDPHLGNTGPLQLYSSLTKALVLFPVASLTVLAFMISYIPIFRGTATLKTITVCRCLGLTSTFASIFAFSFLLAIFANGARELSDRGYSAEYGPLSALSLLSIFLLSLATLLTFWDQPAYPRKTLEAEKDMEQHLTPTKPRRARLSKVILPERLHRL